MIAGHQGAGRKLIAFVVIIGIAIILTAALVVRRKRSAPQNEPPLHSECGFAPRVRQYRGAATVASPDSTAGRHSPQLS